MKLLVPLLILLSGCHNLQEAYPPKQNPNTFIGRWVLYKQDTIENLIWDIKTKDSLTITFSAEEKYSGLYWVEVSDQLQFLLFQYTDTSDILKFRVDSISQDRLYLNQFSFRHFDEKYKVWKEWPMEPKYSVNFHFKRSKNIVRG
jgi:hypothetical protein